MIYQSEQMEKEAILQTAARMCAASRTAPKTRGVDDIYTLVFTEEDKDALEGKMREFAEREGNEAVREWYQRDADNVHAAGAVLLVGAKKAYRGVQKCGFCGFENCGACKAAGANCAYVYVDLGIALSSAAATAGDERVDSRIMFSVGKAAMELAFVSKDIVWQGIPLSVGGKNIFFDRKKKG